MRLLDITKTNNTQLTVANTIKYIFEPDASLTRKLQNGLTYFFQAPDCALTSALPAAQN